MNLKAIVIIIASSCTGRPIFLNGFNTLSIPSVSAIGDVVSVNNDVPTISIASLIDINIACLTPSLVIAKNPNDHIFSPGMQNIFTINVNSIIHLRGFNPFRINFIVAINFKPASSLCIGDDAG